jgi:hypothetical protein
MEEPLCHIEISLSSDNIFIAKVQTDLGGLREYRDENLNGLLRQLVMDLREEFEAATSPES